MRKKWFVIFGVALLAAWVVIGYVATNPVVGDHAHVRRFIAQPQDYGLAAEVVRFPSTDGIPLVAWWLPAPGEARGTVILVHGRDGNRSHMLSRAGFLVRNGYNALAVDLRAHGESGGNYMTPGYLEARDILGALGYLRQRDVHGPIAVLGHSFGAVATLHAAAESPEVAAAVADCAFISPSDMMARAGDVVAKDKNASPWMKFGVRLASSRWSELAVLPVYYLRTGVKLDSRKAAALSAIARLGQRPVLFIAGERDALAPPENALRMYEAAQSPQKALLVVPGAGHNTTYRTSPQQYETAVLDFLQKVFSEKETQGRQLTESLGPA